MWRISYKHSKHKKRRFIQCLLRARTKKFILYYKKRKEERLMDNETINEMEQTTKELDLSAISF